MKGEGGQAIVLIALVALALVFAVGLAIDSGQLYNARRTQQEAADAGAFGGAVALYQSGTASQAIAAAVADITLNGYTNNLNGATVTVNSPPTSGSFANNSSYVEVSITTSVRTSLVPQESGLTQVTARAVAGAAPISSGNAIVALDRTANQALSTSGNGGISATGGNIFVDSSSSSAASISGSGGITVDSPHTIGVVGSSSGSGFSPTPTTGQAVQADPLAAFPKPTTSGLTNWGSCCSNGTVTVQPGIYDQFNYSGNTDITMVTGTYIVRHGLAVTGSGSLNGTGVFIFSTNQNYPTSGTNCGDISFTGNGNFSLSAETTGAYKGMLLFVDPNCNNPTVTLTGNGSGVNVTGTLYVPKGTVKLTGNGNLTIDSQVIADKVQVTGSGSLTVNYDASQNAQPSLPSLAE